MTIDSDIAEKVMGWNMVDRDPTTIPRFSERIGLAWHVVERMRELGYYIAIESPADDDDTWRCSFMIPHDAWKSDEETAPLAICLAALKAI